MHKLIIINVWGDMCRSLALLCIINRITSVSVLMVLYKDFAIYYFLKHLNILSWEIFIAHWISRVDIFLFFSFFFFLYFFFLVSNPLTFVLYIIGQPPLLFSTFHGVCGLTFPFVTANASLIFQCVALLSALISYLLAFCQL